MEEMKVDQKDRMILRDLAKRQIQYAEAPEMQDKIQDWTDHNDLKSDQPMIHFETWTCEQDLLPELNCTGSLSREIELNIQRNILNHELVHDDRVVPGFYGYPRDISIREFDIPVKTEFAEDAQGRELGHQFVHSISDLKKDFHKIQKSTFRVDLEKEKRHLDQIRDVIGDILPVKLITESPALCLSQKIVHLLGMEKMIFSIIDYPDLFHKMIGGLTEDYIEYYRWQEKEGLLLLNNGNSFVGQGTFGFNTSLPARDGQDRKSSADEAVRTTDLWGYMDSQETVSISPEMFGEFFFPYYKGAAEIFGLINYGCCEPVHPLWDRYISQIPNIRKVSISPWCDEEYMGEALSGQDIIYHRKPSPNLIGIERNFDEAAFRTHIRKTLHAARNCRLEFSFRDVYTVLGDRNRPARAVEILRQEIKELR